jgi:hypothetical protein
MKQIKWHKGKPPAIGWWPASTIQAKTVVRWWDGKCWSIACDIGLSAKTASFHADVKDRYQSSVKWTKRWWL